MPIYDLFKNPSGLPTTAHTSVPFEVEALC
jgi:hypothetical protein